MFLRWVCVIHLISHRVIISASFLSKHIINERDSTDISCSLLSQRIIHTQDNDDKSSAHYKLNRKYDLSSGFLF